VGQKPTKRKWNEIHKWARYVLDIIFRPCDGALSHTYFSNSCLMMFYAFSNQVRFLPYTLLNTLHLRWWLEVCICLMLSLHMVWYIVNEIPQQKFSQWGQFPITNNFYSTLVTSSWFCGSITLKLDNRKYLNLLSIDAFACSGFGVWIAVSDIFT